MNYFTPQERIEAVKAFAKDHYDKDGWDIVVETMSDEDIQVAYGLARTPEGAIKNVAAKVGAAASYRDDIVASGDDQSVPKQRAASHKPARKNTTKKATSRRTQKV